MGRAYYGDIKGKFWVEIQSSNAPERFGCIGSEPSIINYYTDDKEAVEEEIDNIKKELGEYLNIIDDFYNKSEEGYGLEDLNDYIKKHQKKSRYFDIDYLMREYADLQLGVKILKCLEKKGDCEFTAELW